MLILHPVKPARQRPGHAIVGNRRKRRMPRVMRFDRFARPTLAHESIFRIMLFSIALYRMEAAPVTEIPRSALASRRIEAWFIGETVT
jgi:hypothetical protein